MILQSFFPGLAWLRTAPSPIDPTSNCFLHTVQYALRSFSGTSLNQLWYSSFSNHFFWKRHLPGISQFSVSTKWRSARRRRNGASLGQPSQIITLLWRCSCMRNLGYSKKNKLECSLSTKNYPKNGIQAVFTDAHFRLQ